MRRHRLSDPHCSPALEDLNPRLLHGAQTYLQCLRRRQVPPSGSSEDWARFYLTCDPLLRRFASGCHVPPGDVDDCVQSAWKEITAALPTFQLDGSPSRLGAWLQRIFHSKATDLLRYKARHPSLRLTPQLEAKQTSRYVDPMAELEQEFQRASLDRTLADLRRQMSATNYRAFQLRWIEGHSIKEIAATLNVTPEQVRYRCCRMKRKFCRVYNRNLQNEPGITNERDFT